MRKSYKLMLSFNQLFFKMNISINKKDRRAIFMQKVK